MKKLYVPIFLLFIVFNFCTARKDQSGPGLTVKDDLGTVHKFTRIPERIITLAPNLTEIIYDLGLEKKLVGNTTYCDYPAAAVNVDKVGDLLTVNFEKIVTLKPDLVFITVEGNTKDTYDKFRQLGIKVFASNPRNYEGIKKAYSDIAAIFGLENPARSKVTGWDSTIAKITASVPKGEKTAMFVVDLKPLMLAGKNTFLNEYLQMCGLRNIASDPHLNYPIFSREEILKLDPDYIIIPSGNGEKPSNIADAYPEWSRIKAVKNNNVVFVDWNLFSRPGPRFAAAAADLFTRLHPLALQVLPDRQ